MKKKRRLMVVLLFLFVVISINASYAKVVGFFNQSTNRTEYYSSYDRDETFTDRDEAEEYDNELRAEREENNNNDDTNEDTDSKEDGGGFLGIKFPDIGKMIQDWIIKMAANVAESTTSNNSASGLSPDGMFLNNVLHLETHLPILGSYYTTLSAYIKSIAMSIIVLYALWYGFKVYVLWKDGSPDENPKEIIVRFMLASAFILSGDEMLHIATTFVASIINKIMNIGGSIQGGTVLDFMSRIGMNGLSHNLGITVMFLILEIVYFFQYWKMMIHTVMLGIEFYVLRLIMPLPCVNLVNPQSNTWSAYVTTLIKAYAGICLNILLLSIGVKIHDTSAGGQWCGLYACAFLITANKSKELLNQFIVGSQSGVSGSSVMGTAGQIITIGKQVFKGAVTGGAGAALP